MGNLEARNNHISQVTDLARSTHNIASMFVTGDDSTKSTDILLLAVADDDNSISSAYAKLNYLLTSELNPVSAKMIKREPSRLVKKFETDDGFSIIITLCTWTAASCDGWYRPLFDQRDVVAALSGQQVTEDILCDIHSDDAAEKRFTARSEKTAEPEPAPEPAPEPEPAAAEPSPDPAAAAVTEAQPAEDDGEDEYWSFVSRNMKAARRAIASESYIHASELINLLRRMVIELICVRNGVNENFENAIDFVECEEKEMLSKTFPAALDKSSMISALGVITELFDRLG